MALLAPAMQTMLSRSGVGWRRALRTNKPAARIARRPDTRARAVRGFLLAALLVACGGASHGAELHGFNVIVAPGHPFGGPSAARALEQAREAGANAVAIVPFLWQPSPTSAAIVRGTDMPDDELRRAIRQARSLGLYVMVKPHVWVPQSWAGAVAPETEDGWHAWFAAYRSAIEAIARIAAQEHADAFAVGTELVNAGGRGEWNALIAAVRAVFPGTLVYVAHNAEEAEAVPYWHLLDAVGVTLYPPLGADGDRPGRLAAMQAIAARLDALAARTGKPVIVGEIGLRSARGAAAMPWESAEERAAPPDPALQADVLGDWLAVLDRPAVRGVLVWRWFTDPDAGGPADTDFTVQGKPAAAMLRCAWTGACRGR
jgi:hypothetical protein